MNMMLSDIPRQRWADRSGLQPMAEAVTQEEKHELRKSEAEEAQVRHCQGHPGDARQPRNPHAGNSSCERHQQHNVVAHIPHQSKEVAADEKIDRGQHERQDEATEQTDDVAFCRVSWNRRCVEENGGLVLCLGGRSAHPSRLPSKSVRCKADRTTGWLPRGRRQHTPSDERLRGCDAGAAAAPARRARSTIHRHTVHGVVPTTHATIWTSQRGSGTFRPS